MSDNVPGEVAELDFDRMGFIDAPETDRRRTVGALIVGLAHLQPEAGGGDRGHGSGLGVLSHERC